MEPFFCARKQASKTFHLHFNSYTHNTYSMCGSESVYVIYLYIFCVCQLRLALLWNWFMVKWIKWKRNIEILCILLRTNYILSISYERRRERRKWTDVIAANLQIWKVNRKEINEWWESFQHNLPQEPIWYIKKRKNSIDWWLVEHGKFCLHFAKRCTNCSMFSQPRVIFWSKISFEPQLRAFFALYTCRYRISNISSSYTIHRPAVFEHCYNAFVPFSSV